MLYRAADQVVPIEIAAGVEIVSEGEPAEHLFVLLDGQVEVTGRAGAPSPCSDDWRHPPASLTETVRVRIATSWAADHFDGP